MNYGFDSYTRFSGFGTSWVQFSPISEFLGIALLFAAGGKCLMAQWVQDADAENYNLYIRPDSDDIFHDQYRLGKFSSSLAEMKFRTEADGITLLNSMRRYYIGVRAEAAGMEDSNTAVLDIRPAFYGVDGFVNDRHFSLVE